MRGKLDRPGSRLSYARRRRRYTRRVLGHFAGLTEHKVRAYEMGLAAIPLRDVKRLAWLLEVSVAWVLGETDDMPDWGELTRVEKLYARCFGAPKVDRIARLRERCETMQHRER